MRNMTALLASTGLACMMAAEAGEPVSGAAVATPAADAPKKAETVAESMLQRRVFDTADSAAAYLNTCAEQYSDFDSPTAPLVARGLDDEGNFDPAIYVPGQMRVLVAVLKNRTKDDKGNALPSTVKAIVVAPIPSLNALLNSDSGKVWLDSIVDKELNHIAVRALRQADDVASVADQIPTTLEGYTTSQRESGGIMETFDLLFKQIIAALAAKSPAWAKRRLIKTELKKAMESKAYAADYYPELEDRGDKPSLFVMALQAGQKVATQKGLDPAIFDKWLATRNDKTLKAVTDESDDFDLDDLDLTDAPAADAAPVEESAPATE